jgi:hypothetical protein
MKRDMDLAREILLWIEKYDTGSGGRLPNLSIEGRSHEEVSAHVRLLREANLIDAINASSMRGTNWIPRRLTWEGHDFLEASRNESFWQKAKERALSVTGGLTFEALKEVLKQLVKEAMTAT